MISPKLEKLINLAYSDSPNEAGQSARMAVSLMMREGIGFEELLFDPSKFHLEALVTLARPYSVRTTKTPTEAQKLFAELLAKTNEVYNPKSKPSSSDSSDQSEYLRTREERLKQREKVLKQKEENVKHREHRLRFTEQRNEQSKQGRAEPKTKAKQESYSSKSEWFKSSHNIKYINNHFLNKCITRPFRTIQLFFVSLFYGMFHSFLINIALFFAIFFGFEFTYHPGIISFFFIVAFPFMVWKSYRLYDTWY